MKSTSGITTRSKAKLAPDQWTIMSLPAKVLIHLILVKINLTSRLNFFEFYILNFTIFSSLMGIIDTEYIGGCID